MIFLPKCSSNLNPVETKVNRNLKKDVCANQPLSSKIMYYVCVFGDFTVVTMTLVTGFANIHADRPDCVPCSGYLDTH